MRLFRRRGGIMIALLFVVIGAAFLTQVVPYRQILESQQQVDDARSRLAALEVQNGRLEADITALGTDSEVEKLAREKLGYIKPGETAFVVVDPPEVEGEGQVLPVDQDSDDVRTWVDKIWDFLTGADVESGD